MKRGGTWPLHQSLGFKVTVHLERCFQFSVYNFVNMHRTPTTYISVESLRNYLNDGEKFA